MIKYFLFLLTVSLLGCNSDGYFESDEIHSFGGRGNIPGMFNKPRGAAVSLDGNLYIVDMTGRIQVFDPQGKFLFLFNTPAIEKGKPTGLGFAPNGNLLVADTHYHRVLDSIYL